MTQSRVNDGRGPFYVDSRVDKCRKWAKPAYRKIDYSSLCLHAIIGIDGNFQVAKRIVFTIPYEERFTVVGTTDVAFAGDANHVKIDPEEITNKFGADILRL